MSIDEEAKKHNKKVKLWLIYQQFRIDLWLSVEQAAEQCGVSVEEYLSCENGDIISGQVLGTLWDKMGLSLLDLMDKLRNISK